MKAAQTAGQHDKEKEIHCAEYKLCSGPRTAPGKRNSFSVCASETLRFLGDTGEDEVTSVRKVEFRGSCAEFQCPGRGQDARPT